MARKRQGNVKLTANHKKLLALIANGMSGRAAFKEVWPHKVKEMSKQAIDNFVSKIKTSNGAKSYHDEVVVKTEEKIIKEVVEQEMWTRKKSYGIMYNVISVLKNDFEQQSKLNARDPITLKALASKRNDTARTMMMIASQLDKLFRLESLGDIQDAPKVVFEGADKLEDMPIEDTVLEPLQANSEPEPITLDNTNT